MLVSSVRFSLLFVLQIFIYKINCKCEKSYVIFCDDLSDLDLEEPDELARWRDLVIGNGKNNDSSRMCVFGPRTIPFYKLIKLNSITLLNKVEDIKMFAFVSDHLFTNLESFTIYGGTIKRMKFTTFDSYKMRKLRFVNTDLEYMHAGSFYNCHIRTMDFSGNKLESIEKDVFVGYHGSNETKELILRNNVIQVIQQDSLPDSLELLDLDNNKLRVLNVNVFNNLVNLRELSMSHNQITTIPLVHHMTKLHTLMLSHNEIISPQMKEMNPLKDLQVLDLSYNVINNPYLFESFTLAKYNEYNFVRISLVFNRFTHLVVDNEVLSGHMILFYGNPWHCQCWTLMEQTMQRLKYKRHSCDVKYFSNGLTPFCYQYPGNWTCEEAIYKGPKLEQSDYDVFLSSIKNNKELFNCDLTFRARAYTSPMCNN